MTAEATLCDAELFLFCRHRLSYAVNHESKVTCDSCKNTTHSGRHDERHPAQVYPPADQSAQPGGSRAAGKAQSQQASAPHSTLPAGCMQVP